MRNISVLLLVPALLFAGSVSYTLVTNQEDVAVSSVDGFDLVQVKDGCFLDRPGQPMVPARTVYLLVPADARVSGAEVRVDRVQDLEGRYNLYPTQNPLILNNEPARPGDPEFVVQDHSIYGSTAGFPGSALRAWNAGNKSGFQIVGVLLNPLVYLPAEQKLQLRTRLMITVTYQDHAAPARYLTRSQQECFIHDVAALVINPEDLKAWSPAVRELDDAEIDYLVITDERLANALQPFCEWKISKGINTEIRTTGWVSSHYTGRDLPEKIRNLAVDYFSTRGLKYLLLGGDVGTVPCRRTRAVVGQEVGDIPCDLYFADLQGDWDANGNNVFGEIYEDDVDLFADIYVGRASLDNEAEVNTFVAKVMAYETNPDPDFLKKMLLPSGWLWQSAGYHGRVVNNTIADLTPGDWVDAKLEDPIGPRPAQESVNVGYAFGHLAGHGNQVGVYSENGTALYTSAQAQSQRNGLRKLCILNSMACDPGDIEYNECMAEVLLNNPGGGGIAAMMNSRYGWGTPPVMGPSELFDVSFYSYLFQNDSNQIGILHARSLDYYRESMSYDGCWRWCGFELNLLGDPQLPVWHGPPSVLNVAFTDTVGTGPDTVLVQVRAGTDPVAGAHVCAYKEGEVFARGITDPAGNLALATNAALTGAMSLVVSAPDYLPFRDTVTVIAGAPTAHLVYDSYLVDDAGQVNPNNRLEPGEAVNLFVIIRNAGNLTATNVSTRLEALNAFVTISDSLADYGTVAAGGTGQGDGFALRAVTSVPQNSLIDFRLNVTSDQGSWTLPLNVYVGYQGLCVADVDSFAGLLSVTAMGSLGYDCQPANAGRGFRYPQRDTSRLYYGSFVFGLNPSYVVDNYFDHPVSQVNQDWQLADSLRFIIPRWGGSEHVTGTYTDAGFTAPRNVSVTQNSFAKNSPGYNNFAILVYDVTNAGSTHMEQTYAGLVCDFNVVATDRLHDWARADVDRRAAWMWSANSTNPTVGVRLLSSYPLSNATIVDPARYLYPDSALTKDMKFRLLNGAIRAVAADRPANWSIAVASGPIELCPGLTRRVAFAIVGGLDSTDFLANCDSAQSWYDLHVGVAEQPTSIKTSGFGLSVMPNPSLGRLRISYQLKSAASARLGLFDAGGRKVASILECGLRAGPGLLDWQAQGVARGVYFLKLEAGAETACTKVLLLD